MLGVHDLDLDGAEPHPVPLHDLEYAPEPASPDGPACASRHHDGHAAVEPCQRSRVEVIRMRV